MSGPPRPMYRHVRRARDEERYRGRRPVAPDPLHLGWLGREWANEPRAGRAPLAIPDDEIVEVVPRDRQEAGAGRSDHALGDPVETVGQDELEAAARGYDVGVATVEVIHPRVLVVHAEGDAEPSPPERPQEVNRELGGGEEDEIEPASRQELAATPVEGPDAALRESAKAPPPQRERANAVHRDVGREAIGEPGVGRADVVRRVDAEDLDVPARARRVIHHQAQPMGVRPVRRREPRADREDSQGRPVDGRLRLLARGHLRSPLNRRSRSRSARMLSATPRWMA